MIAVDKSPTLSTYKRKMVEVLSLIYPLAQLSFLDEVVEEHIQKKFKDAEAVLKNSYTKKDTKTTLLALSDFIDEKKPLVTGAGTMFKQHDKSRNLMFETMQSFLDLRGVHKKEMFKYPKGTPEFNKYNLLQLLT